MRVADESWPISTFAYRLRISTRKAATTFRFDAADDVAAIGRAESIAARFDVAADVILTRGAIALSTSLRCRRPPVFLGAASRFTSLIGVTSTMLGAVAAYAPQLRVAF